MTKQDIELQNFLNTRIVQWMKPQSLWHKCVVNNIPITCVTCFTWICVTIDVCWCDSCVDSCHLWCCKVGGCHGWITTISKLYVRGSPSFLYNLAMISTKLDLRNIDLVFTLRLTRGVSHCGLAIYIKKYLKAKEELWKLKYFTMQRKIWSSKNPLKETQNHTRFWQPARTYCLNMAISGGKKQSLKFSTFAKKNFTKILCMSHVGFFLVTNWWKFAKENPGSRENRFSLPRQTYSNSTPEAMLCSEISVLRYIHIYLHQM